MCNQGAMYMASSQVDGKRSKHNDTMYHLIRDCANTGVNKFEYTRTEHIVADIMTKPQQKVKHGFFTSMLLHDQKIWFQTTKATCNQGISHQGVC